MEIIMKNRYSLIFFGLLFCQTLYPAAAAIEGSDSESFLSESAEEETQVAGAAALATRRGGGG